MPGISNSGVSMELHAELGSGRNACRTVVLQRGGQDHPPDRLGHRAGKARVAMRDGPTLSFVAFEQRAAAPSLAHGGQLPGEVRGVVDGRVVSLAGGRREQVSGVAGEPHTAGAEPLRDERVAGRPLVNGDQLVGEGDAGSEGERFAGERA